MSYEKVSLSSAYSFCISVFSLEKKKWIFLGNSKLYRLQNKLFFSNKSLQITHVPIILLRDATNKSYDTVVYVIQILHFQVDSIFWGVWAILKSLRILWKKKNKTHQTLHWVTYTLLRTLHSQNICINFDKSSWVILWC